MAVPRAAPMPVSSQAHNPPAKSIMKKQAPPSPTPPLSSRSPLSRAPQNIHAMADDAQLGLLHAPDHRARLETSSPTPAPGGEGPQLQEPTSAHYSGYGSYGESIMPPKLGQPNEDRCLSQGAAFLPDFTPGMQSNVCQDRGGERSQGQVLDYRMEDPYLSSQPTQVYQYQYRGPSYATSPRAQDLSNQYYHFGGSGGTGSNDDNPYSENHGLQRLMYGPMTHAQGSSMTTMMQESNGYGASSGVSGGGYGSSGNGIGRRTIGFTDMIEIIPAYRKSEYNRRSDKYATFKNLTPNLKMREMAVHAESMGNTAFH
ncbi:hypothetical protein BGX33_008858 [Mortierella sp. NVP41]|nr:hypothetical protein BGX33_008858 [Mortierella sp. NVP41]